MKYIVTIDPDTQEVEVELDNPGYDGPITHVDDPYGVYHIDADSEEDAIAAAKWEFSIDDIPSADDILPAEEWYGDGEF